MIAELCPFQKAGFGNFISFLSTMIFGLFLVTISAQAELIDNGDGTITDTGFGIMLLKDADMAGTTMTWGEASQWAQDLDFAGYNDWRLPTSLNQDGSGPCFGYDCIGSEMGHLYYEELSNPTGGPPSNIGPFLNVQTVPVAPGNSRYWLKEDIGQWGAMMFAFCYGSQGGNNKSQQAYGWAVRDVIPMPAQPKSIRVK